PERAHTSEARAPLGPLATRGRQRQRVRLPGNEWARLPQVHDGRDLARTEDERELDEAGDARGGLEVAEIGLDRSQIDRAVLRASGAEHGGQGLRLERVSELGSGPVGLDVRD